jgi:transcription antitermination factor NusG
LRLRIYFCGNCNTVTFTGTLHRSKLPIYANDAGRGDLPIARQKKRKLFRRFFGTWGVQSGEIVHFGDRLATLPENLVVGLQSRVGAEEVVTIDSSVKIGQAVEIIEGPFRGLQVVVTCLLPAKERVRVLFEFLGRSVQMEIPMAKVLAA